MNRKHDGSLLADRSPYALAFSVLLGALAAPVAYAADDAPNLLSDPFNIGLGTFVLNSDTEVRLDGATQPGTPVNWEDTFGGGDQSRFRLDGHWRFGDSERHKVRLMVFNSSRNSARTLDEDIDWNGVTYPVDAKVKADFSFDVYQVAYEYALWRRNNYEINGSVGLHYTDLSMSLAVDASSVSAKIKEEASVAAPLPVVGLRGIWALPHNFWLDASAQFFALSFDEYDGNLQDYKIVVTWQPKKWLGIGLGYNQFGIDVDVDQSKFKGSLDWKYQGPMLYYSATF